MQYGEEGVPDFIRHLKQTFSIAYGRDGMAAATQDALLYGQLHEGLRFENMQGPSVLGASSYNTLCVAANSKE